MPFFVFEISVYCLLCAPGYTTFGQVINRNLNCNLVAWQYFDKIHFKLSRYICGHYVIIGKSYFEGCIGQ